MTFIQSVTLGQVWMLTWSAEELAAAGTTVAEAMAEVRANTGDILAKAAESAAETNQRWAGDPLVRVYSCGDHVHVAVTGQLLDVDPDVPLVLWDKNHPVYVSLVREFLAAESEVLRFNGQMMAFGAAITLAHEHSRATGIPDAVYTDILAEVRADLERAVSERLDAINQARETP